MQQATNPSLPGSFDVAAVSTSLQEPKMSDQRAPNTHTKPLVNGTKHPATNQAPTTASTPPNPPLSTFSPNPALHTDPSHKVYMQPSPPLDPSPDDCIVHMLTNGICGSDLHLYHGGRIGDLVVTAPHCLGHEGAGRIVWTGSRVRHLRVGDRVAVEPGVPCGEASCHPCDTAQYNLCPAVQFSGVPPYAGSIRRYHVHRARWLHRLPEGIGWAEGALLEPLGVVLHALERTPVRIGEGVLVAGAGPIGLLCAAVARVSGAWPIVVTDFDEERLRFARGYIEGCRTVKVESGKSEEEVAEMVQAEFARLGSPEPRVSFECVGVANSVKSCLLSTQRGGEVMVIGVGMSTMDGMPFMHASMAEIDLKFINRYHHSWPYAIRLVQSGYIDLKPLVTHQFRLEDAVEAIETASDRSKASIKVHIVDEEDGRVE